MEIIADIILELFVDVIFDLIIEHFYPKLDSTSEITSNIKKRYHLALLLHGTSLVVLYFCAIHLFKQAPLQASFMLLLAIILTIGFLVGIYRYWRYFTKKQ